MLKEEENDYFKWLGVIIVSPIISVFQVSSQSFVELCWDRENVGIQDFSMDIIKNYAKK